MVFGCRGGGPGRWAPSTLRRVASVGAGRHSWPCGRHGWLGLRGARREGLLAGPGIRSEETPPRLRAAHLAPSGSCRLGCLRWGGRDRGRPLTGEVVTTTTTPLVPFPSMEASSRSFIPPIPLLPDENPGSLFGQRWHTMSLPFLKASLGDCGEVDCCSVVGGGAMVLFVRVYVQLLSSCPVIVPCAAVVFLGSLANGCCFPCHFFCQPDPICLSGFSDGLLHLPSVRRPSIQGERVVALYGGGDG